jgi:magnesium chelatase family protein
VLAYQRRISGPLLDRIDLHVEVPALPASDLEGPRGETSASVAARVTAARLRQAERGALTNARLEPDALRAMAALDDAGARLLRSAVDRLRLSGRTYDRLLRVARTLADLDGRGAVAASHVAEAMQFRAVPAAE